MKELESISSSTPNKSSKIFVLTLILIGILTIFCIKQNLNTRSKPNAIMARNTEFQEIVIPFELKNGWIILGVTVENRNLEAIYDTGCAANWISGNPSSPFKSFVTTGITEKGWCGLNHPGYFPKLTVANI